MKRTFLFIDFYIIEFELQYPRAFDHYTLYIAVYTNHWQFSALFTGRLSFTPNENMKFVFSGFLQGSSKV